MQLLAPSAPNVPVKIGISVKGFDRYYTVTTDANGNFSYTFTPGANEAGIYTLWATHPDVTTKAVQATFTIAGLQIDQTTMNVKMAKNRTMDIPVKLTNTGEAPIANLQFTTETSAGITAGAISTGTALSSGESATITLRISADANAPDTGYVALKVSGEPSASGGQSGTITARLDVGITLVTAIPIIGTSPSYIDSGMVRGDQKIAEFIITNTGEETLKNARIEGPSTSWMTLTVNKAIGDIKPGVSTSVGIFFRPPADLPQAVYDDTVVIYSDNHIPYTYHIQVTVTSSAVGNVLFDVLNEFFEDVPNATITFQHQLLTELIYTVKTGQDGSVMAYDIPEGRYTFNISPPAGHLPTSGTFVINPGLTTDVPIALQMKLVDVTWSVEPTAIQDQYEIVIHQTFETNVPAPVLITEPPSLTLPDMQPGQILNGEFTVTNYGLIAVDNVKMTFPTSFGDYDIEVYTSVMPSRLNAMQKVTVPYRITKRLQSAISYQPSSNGSLFAWDSDVSFSTPQLSLFDEVAGYGGSGGCVTASITTSGGYTCCPFAVQQTTCSCSSSLVIGSPCYGGLGGGGWVGGGWIPGGGDGQSSGNAKPAPSPTPIQPPCCGEWCARVQAIKAILGKSGGTTGKDAYAETKCTDENFWGYPRTTYNDNIPSCLNECVVKHEEVHQRQCTQFGWRFYNDSLNTTQLETEAYNTEISCLCAKIAAAKCCCAACQ